ncbi:MAG: hypothetical protein SR3Q1_00440 [Quinella sp. 3Q1]|nr:hypothetical protein [Quinella sp. 3Q1]
MVHVCFGLHDRNGRYSKFTGTTIFSIFENTKSEVTIHILHDNTLTDDNRDKFLELTNRYSQSLKFYNVEELCADKINKYVELVPSVTKSRVSMGTFFKFLIPEILDESIDKVIYLDSDIIVNLDINELWQIELGDHPLAAVLEIANNTKISLWSQYVRDNIVKEENYFNAGMMIMNLKVLRNEEDNILAGIKFRGKYPKNSLFDQEIFNQCFETRVLNLPVKFNRIIKESRNNGFFVIDKEIYHYAGGKVGLRLDISDLYNRLWWNYFIRTPWFDVDTIDKILKGATDSVLKPSSVPQNKARVFIVDMEHAYRIEKNFSVRDEEEVYVVDPEREENLQRLEDIINSGRGKKTFFIAIPNVVLKLKEMKFVEGKDYFNVSEFYSPVWANHTNNYDLILSM